MTREEFIKNYATYAKYGGTKLYSRTWDTGGTWGSWDGHGDVTPEEPLDFIEFDDLLLEICPNISYLLYKKLKNSSVTKEDDSESDYYGGTRHIAKWVCDLGILYDTMTVYGLI